MTAPVNFYADPSSLAGLKKGAGDQDPKALREAARQFESIFTQMMLKSMRDATKSFGTSDSPLNSEQTDFYREMFDNQIAMQLSKGKGLGLADMLVKQLTVAGGSVTPAQAGVHSSTKSPVASTTVETRDSGVEIRKNLQSSGALSSSSLSTAHRPPPSVSDSSSQGAAGGGRMDAQGVTPPAAIATPMQETQNTSTTLSATSQSSRVQNLATSPADFIAQLWPHAEKAGRELGVDPRTLIAQAALETGWGKYVPCNPDGTCSFNLFGIKAGSRWRGASVGVDSVEYQDGVAVRQRASFRAYDSPADSFRDYASLIKSSPRYAGVVGSGSDATAFASALQQGGYATDPNYATKLAAIADRLSVALKTDANRPLAFGGRVSIGGET